MMKKWVSVLFVILVIVLPIERNWENGSVRNTKASAITVESSVKQSDFLIENGKIIKYIGEINVDKTVNIPKGVTSIGSEAFNVEWERGSEKRISICIPKKVKLDPGAFRYAIPMNITFEEGRTEIEAWAFSMAGFSNEGNMTVILPSTVKILREGAFYNDLGDTYNLVLNEGLEIVEEEALYRTKCALPSTVKILMKEALGYCPVEDEYSNSIQRGATVVLPEGLEVIGAECAEFDYLQKPIYIPASVRKIEEHAFLFGSSYCNGGFVVAKENKYYKSEKGWLYSKDGKKLYYADGGYEDIIIPEGVEYVCNYAISQDEEEWNDIYMPSTLKKIDVNVSPYYAYPIHFSGDAPKLIGKNTNSAMENQSTSNIMNLKYIYVPEGKKEEYIKAFKIKKGCEKYVIEEKLADVNSIIKKPEFEICDNVLLRYNGKQKTVNVPKGVTEIAFGAFTWNDVVMKIQLPDSVTSIDFRAFAYCTQLKSINLPRSIENIHMGAFDNCSSLTEIELPNIDTIITEMFRDCINLTKVTLPDSIISIEARAFENCTKLKKIILPKNLDTISYDAFQGCNKITKIYKNPIWRDDQKISSDFIINNGKIIKYIGEINVNKEITIPKEVTSIGSHAFVDKEWYLYRTINKKLSICIPKNVTLDQYAFTEAVPMNVTFEEGRTRVEAYAFYETDENMTITLPSSVKTIVQYSFYNMLGTLVLNEGLTTIGKSALAGSDAILPSTVKILKDNALQDYSDIIQLPEGLETIGNNCIFIDHPSEYLYIPESVEKMGDGAIRLGNNFERYCDEGFIVSKLNMHFMSKNGWLYTKDGKRLLYASNYYSDLIVPEGVEYVGPNSLNVITEGYKLDYKSGIDTASYTKPQEIYLPESLKTISSLACTNGIIHFTGDIPPVIYGDSDSNYDDDIISDTLNVVKIYVPIGRKDVYIKALQIKPECVAYVIEEEAKPESREFVIKDNVLLEYHGSDAEVRVPEGVVKISGGAFSHNEMITGVRLPGSLKELSPYAFAYCTNLTKLEIPDGVRIIGNSAFSSCFSLKEIILPKSLNRIEEKTFKLCTSLKKITLPDTIQQIGDFAFDRCNSLESVFLPYIEPEIKESAFYKCNNLKYIFGFKGTWAEEFAMEYGLHLFPVFRNISVIY